MAHDICLHPDIIDEVIEDLFATDLISQDQIKKLKNDALPVDPLLMMEVRQKEVKKEPLIDLTTERKAPFVMKRKFENLNKESLTKVKNLNTIDKEIFNTRKYLEEFKNKLEKKNECLLNTISDLEKENESLYCEKEKEEIDSPVVLNLNEEETTHYFNLHLDHLEDNMNKTQHRDKVKTWRPTEIKSSPVINVITHLKDCNVGSTSLRNMEEEIQLLKLCNTKLFHVTGKSLETPSELLTEGQNNNVAPNNSPTFSVCVILDEKNKLTSRQREIIKNVLRIWKLFVRKRKIHRWSEVKADSLRINLLRYYFSLWISFTKQCKDTKETHLASSSDKLEVMTTKCCMNKKIGIINIDQADSESNQKKYLYNTDQVQKEPPAIKKRHQIVIKCNKVIIPSKDKTEKCPNLAKNLENTSDQMEIHVKTLTLEDVGLTQNTNTNQVCKKHLGRRPQEVKDNISCRCSGEPLLHRFWAQEKIIKQQRELIEKQSRIIFDLQAKCLETESKLNWTLAEIQLADAESQIINGSKSSENKQTKKSESKHPKYAAQVIQECYTNKTKDKTEILVKNMLERQAYCSQLAEQTKTRKKRIEEEREKFKLEQEEKEKHEKEEGRRQRILQLKMEQEIAQEKERNTFARRKREAELIEKAIKHYRNNLLRRSFVTIKMNCLDVSVQSEDCARIYKQKLIRKFFYLWKEEVKNSIQLKHQFADSYYYERLMRLAWDKLCKVYYDYKIRLQVSEDLYNLKLQERMFRRWQEFAAQQFMQNCCKVELAAQLHKRQLLRHFFLHWKEIPRLMFKEREKEQRRRAWRHSVQQLIPDFTPAYDDEA